jgi:hypothetical protein
MHEIDYTKKPSITTLRAAIRKAAAAGARAKNIHWGENWLQLEQLPSGWTGWGWIGNSSGQDLAHELNKN